MTEDISLSPKTTILEKDSEEFSKLDKKLQKLILETENGWMIWKDACYSYRRLTFVVQDYCTVCDKYSSDCKTLYTDNYIGTAGLQGWMYCNNCAPFVKYACIYKELTSDHLFRYTYKWLSKYKLNFWRISKSDPTKQPYMVTDSKIMSEYVQPDSVYYKKNRVYINLEWKGSLPGVTNIDTLYKAVFLSNIICFNRDIFGYNANNCRFLSVSNQKDYPDWYDKWVSRFKFEYDIAKSWDTLELCINRTCQEKNIILPTECKYCILNYIV
tara:strand:+ start:1347 stop:2156 length:810 start_codon:yes stop_codon:yes gene_type:complete